MPGSPVKEPAKYTEDEVKHELLSGSDFTIVVDETQRRLGKILSPDDLLRLFGIYDSLRLPPEVIVQLITHCIKESSITGDGRAPSMRYIEKAAYTWEREGVFTLDRAEEYLKALEERKTVRGKIKQGLDMRDREFSATQKRYVDDWITMGFSPDAIAIAYDRTVVNKGSLNWPYMNGILKKWHDKGMHTAELVMEKDSSQLKSGAARAGALQGSGVRKHGEPNREEIERMQRLLNKTKES
jgi:DnaD/phage-associated family protein